MKWVSWPRLMILDTPRQTPSGRQEIIRLAIETAFGVFSFLADATGDVWYELLQPRSQRSDSSTKYYKRVVWEFMTPFPCRTMCVYRMIFKFDFDHH